MVSGRVDGGYLLPAVCADGFHQQIRPRRQPIVSREHKQRRTGEKVGRNDPCPCGSGKNYKSATEQRSDLVVNPEPIQISSGFGVAGVQC